MPGDRVIDLTGSGNGATVGRVNVPGVGKVELKIGPEHMPMFQENPAAFTQQVMDRKFGEFRSIADQFTQGMSPLQKAALSEYVRMNTEKGGIPYAQGSAPVMRSGAPQTSMQGVPYQGTPEMTRTQQAAYMTMPMPVVGDLTGLAADVQMYMNDPDSRSLANYFMTGLGVLGLGAAIPPVSVMRELSGEAARKAADPLWHQIGNRKLPQPLDEIAVRSEQVKEVPPPRPLMPEDLEGMSLVALPGDRSDVGRMVTGINDTEFSDPVYLEGGHGFMRTHEPYGQAWASNKSKATNISNRIRAAGEKTGQVAGVYVPMGHQSANFSTMMSDTLYEMIKGSKITKKAKRLFDSELKQIRPEWPGIDSPEARTLLDNNGALRSAFVNLADKKSFVNMGFPDPALARYAIIDQQLLDAPMYAGGLSISEMDPTGAITKYPAMPHKTYDTQFAGRYLGGLSDPVPYETLFPDFYAARRAEGKPVQNDIRSFELAPPTQLATPEWVDNVSRFLEGVRR